MISNIGMPKSQLNIPTYLLNTCVDERIKESPPPDKIRKY
jgi:hypothetical protein